MNEPAAIAEQYLNIVVLQVADRDIEFAVLVEVTHCDAVGEVAHAGRHGL